jgi:hypothetical protein
MDSAHTISRAQVRELLQTYFKAKDENRPHLMVDAFHEEAAVDMSVQTGAISFPSRMEGRDAVTDGLVRNFGQMYENVYSFYLDEHPARNRNGHACHWMVVMTEKSNGSVRVGCGSYEWTFSHDDRWLVRSLHITIAAMAVLPKDMLDPVFHWAGRMPYPWCSNEQALVELPRHALLAPVRDYLLQARRDTRT